MTLENIREIGKEIKHQDLSDLVVGERVLLTGFKPEKTSGVVVWRQMTGEVRRFLVASRTDIENRSDPNFKPIYCQLYTQNEMPGSSVHQLTCDSEGGMKRSITKELYPGHSLSFPDTTFAEYNKRLVNVGL